MLTSLYDLIELPNYFYRIPQSIAYFLSIILIGLSLAISEMGGLKFVLGSVPVPQETDSTPAMTRPGAGPSSAMVTRPWVRGNRGMSIEPEMEFRPEVEFEPEIEILAETCEGGLGPLDQYQRC